MFRLFYYQVVHDSIEVTNVCFLFLVLNTTSKVIFCYIRASSLQILSSKFILKDLKKLVFIFFWKVHRSWIILKVFSKLFLCLLNLFLEFYPIILHFLINVLFRIVFYWIVVRTKMINKVNHFKSIISYFVVPFQEDRNLTFQFFFINRTVLLQIDWLISFYLEFSLTHISVI